MFNLILVMFWVYMNSDMRIVLKGKLNCRDEFWV